MEHVKQKKGREVVGVIENKRVLSAKIAGLIDHFWKYNKPCNEIKEGRFYCKVEDWKPDENWSQMMFILENTLCNTHTAIVYLDVKKTFEAYMESAEFVETGMVPEIAEELWKQKN